MQIVQSKCLIMFEEVLLRALGSQKRWKKGKKLVAMGNYSVHLDVNVLSWYIHFFLFTGQASKIIVGTKRKMK